MRSFDIALKNIKKSRGDYSVYFFTLILGVAIFYMFNAVGTQGIMKKAMLSSNETVEMFVRIIGGVSVGVAFVLGLLIIYANNFLIRRRKKEFGIYMLLGMSAGKVSKILFIETCIVGFISLIAGILIGIIGSQCLSVVVAKMFVMDLSGFEFDISPKALLMTVICFVCIYIVVLIFNTASVRKNRLIDLMMADRKAEKVVLKNPAVCIVLFVLSLAALIWAWVNVGFFGKTMTRNIFLGCIIAGIVCTFTLFWSAGGFVQKLCSGMKGMYRKGLNAFVVRQFTNNINTSSFSMALISLLLFLALLFFSTGFSIRSYVNARLYNSTPVDITVEIFESDKDAFLNEIGIPVDSWSKDYLEVPVFMGDDLTVANLLGDQIGAASERFQLADWDVVIGTIRLSDYNRIQDMYGRKPLELKDDEYAIICSFDLLNQFFNGAIKEGNTINVSGCELKPGYDAVVEEFIVMSGMETNLGAVVLPDVVIDSGDSIQAVHSNLVIANYIDDNTGLAVETVLGSDPSYADRVFFTTSREIRKQSISITVIIVFVVLYIGVVFVVACAAILALKMLSDSIDSASRYKVIEGIGAGRSSRMRALFVQVLMNFLFPLVLAVIDCMFGARFIQGFLESIGMISMGSGIALSCFIMLVIYGGYFLTTYEGCRKIIGI